MAATLVAPPPSVAEISGACSVSELSLGGTSIHTVPIKMEKHLEFLDFNVNGDLILGASSLTTRHWSGSLWYYRKGINSTDVDNPSKSFARLDLKTGVLDGKFIDVGRMIIGLDSGGVVLVNLNKEGYLEQSVETIEHDDILASFDVWEDGSVATVGGDQRLNILTPDLTVVQSFQPVHGKLVSSVSCSQKPSILVTASREGTVRLWDTRQQRPATTVLNNEQKPCSSVTWNGDQQLIVGCVTGELMLLDVRSQEPLNVTQLCDREVFRVRWSPDKNKLAVSLNDVQIGLVKEVDGMLEKECIDTRHSDYVRGLAWSDDNTLWSAGWDHKVLTHSVQ